jgi:hypothetical protein
MAEDQKTQELFEAANRDAQLKARLLANPRKVAEEWGVKLEERAVERLTKLGAFVELANEVAQGSVFRCDPRVCYPVDVWLRSEAVHLIRRLVYYHIFYPPPDRIRGIEDRISQNLGLLRQGR